MYHYFRTQLHLGQGEPRTLGNLRQSYNEWQESGANRNDAKRHNNAIHQAVFDGSDDTEIIDILPPPELHLLLGVVLTLCTGI